MLTNEPYCKGLAL